LKRVQKSLSLLKRVHKYRRGQGRKKEGEKIFALKPEKGMADTLHVAQSGLLTAEKAVSRGGLLTAE
jgi:hypothetical protein